MRIAVMAAGAVGGYFGARMAAAGHDVFFIARGANLEAIKKNGLSIESVHGDLHLEKPNVTDDPAKVGPVDAVFFAVKLWDTEKAAEQMKPLLGPNTRVITLQNGVDSYERLAPIIGAERAIPGITYVVSVIDRPGVIKQTSKFQTIICGTIDGKPDAPLKAFVDAAKAASINVTLSDNIARDRWQKFIFLSATSGATAITRMPMGPILADPDTRALFRSIMQETLAVGRAKGVDVDPGYADERMTFADANSPATMKASMANDLDRGNRLELDWLAGQVSRLGKELKVPTPVNDAIYAALKLHRMGTPR
ncbi:MAG TPA: 2-dehydropantoate 2-reductase [Pseudolabrys sp.]|nr:2-dehydropantoate 2-reductase [Pseudolabrys sp.]